MRKKANAYQFEKKSYSYEFPSWFFIRFKNFYVYIKYINELQ